MQNIFIQLLLTNLNEIHQIYQNKRHLPAENTSQRVLHKSHSCCYLMAAVVPLIYVHY